MPTFAMTVNVGECDTDVNSWATHTDRPFVDVVLTSQGGHGHAEYRLQFAYEDDIDRLTEALDRARFAFLSTPERVVSVPACETEVIR